MSLLFKKCLTSLLYQNLKIMLVLQTIDLFHSYRSLVGFFDKYIYCLIADHLLTFHPISDIQWGFQASKSTVTALLTVTDDCLQSLE